MVARPIQNATAHELKLVQIIAVGVHELLGQMADFGGSQMIRQAAKPPSRQAAKPVCRCADDRGCGSNALYTLAHHR